jgi:hypothetical protein
METNKLEMSDVWAGELFIPISIDDFMEMLEENNPTEDVKGFRTALERAAKAKNSCAACDHCGSLIWAIGTALVGWNTCFSCLTGEADCTEDYEIDSVCF